jgi:glycosyltransferase involved in cell wall biosynthesis
MTAPAPRISVVTICRNVLPSLKRTVESVLAQDYLALDYWIVDGASSDGTREYLERLAPRGVRFVSEADTGISDAMNKGVRLCDGDWVAHLHAGDEYPPGALAAVARAAARFPEAEVLCGAMLKREPAGEVVYGSDPELLRKDMTVNHPATWIRRSVFEAHGGFDERYRRVMDYEFFLRLKLAGVRFAVIPEVLAVMEYGGLSERSLWETLGETQRVRRALLESGLERRGVYRLFLFLRGTARRVLQRVGLGRLVDWYRRRHALLRKR